MFNKLTAQWDLSEAAVATPVRLLGLIGEDTDYFEGLKRGNRVAATQLVQIRGICLETSECDLPTFQFSPVMSRRII